MQPISFPSKVVDASVVDAQVTAINFGNTSAPVPAVQSKSTAIAVITDQQIDKLGERASSKFSATNTKILASVKATDVDGFGTQLNGLIATAKGLDPTKMKKGLVAKLFGMASGGKEKFLAQYESVDQRMTALINEMDKSANLISGRIDDLEVMYNENLITHQELEEDVRSGQIALENLKVQFAAEQQATDAFAAQRLSDMTDKMNRLEKRIDDLIRGMQLAKLAAPEIRMMQQQNRLLVTSFRDIKTTTIPAFQGVFSRYIIGQETKKAAALQNAVADATDAAFRMQADQLRQNAQDVAKAQQRSVVSIETLEHMQAQLLGALDDVSRITNEGRAARAAALPKLQSLETALIERFSPPQLTNG